MNDIFAVHLSNSLNHISEIVSCLSNRKGPCLILVLEQSPTVHVLKNDVKTVGKFKHTVKFCYFRVVE